MIRKIKVIYSLINFKLFNKKTPLFVDLWVTYGCNSKCKYCKMPSKKGEMNTQEIFKIIDQLSHSGCIFVNITGGEPLIRNDIIEIINYIRLKKMKVNLLTNGKLIEKIEPLLHKIDRISISLDGPKEIHDNIRGKGSFEKAVNAIRLASNKTDVTILTTLTKKNINSVDFLLKLSQTLNTDIFFEKVDSYLLSKNNNLLLDEYKKKKIIKELIKNKKKFSIINTYSHLNYLLNYPQFKNKLTCYAGELYLNVLPNGDIIPCCVGQDLITPLNIRSNSLDLCIERLERNQCKHCDKAPSFFNSIFQSVYDLNVTDIKEIYNLIKSKKL